MNLRQLAGGPLPVGPLPPHRMQLVRDGRPLKRWRYAGLFGDDVMVCAAEVQILAARQVFWAVWDRERGELAERTRFVRRGRVRLGADRLRVVDRGAEIDLMLEPERGVDTVCPSGKSWAWTRKSPLRARGSVNHRAVDLRGILDESAGYHAREIDWRWCAGVGRTADGRAATWNLVTGINDPHTGSERSVWLDGEAFEPGPVRFASDLSSICFQDGGDLRFAAEARRARSDDFGVFASDYEQPFGTFSGELPGGIELTEGHGVMERHRARW